MGGLVPGTLYSTRFASHRQVRRGVLAPPASPSSVDADRQRCCWLHDGNQWSPRVATTPRGTRGFENAGHAGPGPGT